MAESKDAITDTTDQPSSADIRSDIERTRAEMDSTFDALERKMTPGQILEEAWHLTRGGTTAGANKLWQVAREHPLPAAVIGVGLGWLLVDSSRGEGRSSRSRLGEDGYTGRGSNLQQGAAGYGAYTGSYNADYVESWDTAQGSGGISERVSSAAGAVKDAALHAKDAVKDAASSAGHKVADVTGSVREHASDLGHSALDKASELRSQTKKQARRAQTGFWQLMEENPLAVGIATLTLGVLGGLALPSTRREDELLGETRDRMVDRLEEVGRETLDKGKQVAGTAVETLKEEAENAGLTASGIADKVREAGRHTKEAVTEEIKNQDLPGVTTPSTTAGTYGTGTSDLTGSRGRTTPRETITPVEQPDLVNKR